MSDEEFLKTWELTRQHGFKRFVAARGTTWGMSFATTYLVGKWLNDHVFDPKHAAAAFLVFMVAGCFYSPISWWQREDRYKRLLESRTVKASGS